MKYFEILNRVPNSDDELHCTQAALVMALQALGHVESFTLKQADEATGFREGVETWPYRMLAWLGENGYQVRHVDALDALMLMDDPEGTLRASGLDEETLQYFLSISDFEAEGSAIRRCVASENVQFLTQIPDVGNLSPSMKDGWLPIVSLDAALLAQRSRDGFDGHVVLITGEEDGNVVVQDPGPPPLWDWRVPLMRVQEALRSPVDTSGTITYVRRLSAEG